MRLEVVDCITAVLWNVLPPISKTIQIRGTRLARHCWRSKGGLIKNILLWTQSHGRAAVGHLARSYLQQLCTDTGCSLVESAKMTDDRGEWRGRVREIHAQGDDDEICLQIICVRQEYLISYNHGPKIFQETRQNMLNIKIQCMWFPNLLA